MAAVLRCFPGRAPKGGDRVPAPSEIANCTPYLAREIDLLRPVTVIAVLIGVAAIGVVATLAPTWRATRINPVDILRR